MLTPKCRPRQLRRDEGQAVWKAENCETGERYVALFNLSDEERPMTVEADEVDCEPAAALTELWTGEKKYLSAGVLQAEIPPHGCAVYKVCQGNRCTNYR